MKTTAAGTLYLMPNALDLGAPAPGRIDAVLPIDVLRTAAALGHWAVENAKSARAFLKRVDQVVPLARAIQDIAIVELPIPVKGRRPPVAPDLTPLLAPLMAGQDLGLLSEAGMPAVADPGAALVAAAHAQGVQVVPLVGPSAILLAVSASGLSGQCFAFVGYVPSDAGLRLSRLRELEARSRKEQQAQWMIETPYRNGALFSAMLQALAPSTRLSIASGLTMAGGWTRTDSIAGYRARPVVFDSQHPVMFGLQAV